MDRIDTRGSAIAYFGRTFPDDVREKSDGKDGPINAFPVSEMDDIQDRLEGTPTPIRCVFCEYPLEWIDPVELIETIRSVRTIPIVFVSTRGSDLDLFDNVPPVGTTHVSLGPDRSGPSDTDEPVSDELSHVRNRLTTHASGPSDNPLVEQTIVGAYELDGDRFSSVNRTLADLFGYKRDELVGQSVTDVVATQDRSLVRTQLHLLEVAEITAIETKLGGVGKGGEEISIRLYGEILDAGPDPTVTGFIRKIAEGSGPDRRVRAEFDTSYEFTGLLRPNGTFVDVAETSLPSGALTAKDVVDTNLWETFWFQSTQDARTTARQAVSRAGEGNRFRDDISVLWDGRERNLDFSVRPLTDEEGTLSLLMVNCRAVTERTGLEQLRETIIQRVTDAIVVIDENWRFTMVDERAQEIYEMSEDELLGRHFWDVFEAGKGTVFQQMYEQVMETREPTSFEAFYDGADDLSGLVGWFQVHVYPEDHGGLSFYFREISDRKQREQRIEGMNDALASFMGADSKRRVCDILVDAAESELYFPFAVCALFEEESGTLQPVSLTETAETYIDDFPIFDGADGAGLAAFIDGEPTTLDATSIDMLDGNPRIDRLTVHPMGTHGVLVTGSAFPNPDFVRTIVENMRTTLDRIEHEKRLQNREECLEEQNETLSRLNRINTIIRNIDNVLVGAETRTEIQRAVCEELTSENAYTFAWFGELDSATGRIHPRELSGADQGYLEALEFTRTDASTEWPLAIDAGHTREPQVKNDLLSDPPFETWREAALRRGFRSNTALPVLYEGSLYGIIDLYSTNRNVFDDLEMEVLVELSETIGHAINAVESKKAIVSDEIVELDIEMAAEDHALIRFVRRGEDREFELKGVMASEQEQRVRVFFELTGIPHEEFVEFAKTRVEIHQIELLSESDDERSYRCLASSESLIHWLIDRGVTPQSLSITGANAELRVQVGAKADLRSFVDQFHQVYSASEVVANRQHERRIRSRTNIFNHVTSTLTDRQHEVLKVAYLSGYFETPRARTATEIAESLGVTQPTFSTHLRNGLSELFSYVFDGRDGDLDT